MPKYDILESIVRNLEINPEWLLTGKGEMLKNSDIQGGTSPMCAQPAAQEQDTTTALLKEQLREKDNEIKALNREIGRLQAENELLYKKTATITSTPTLQPKKKTQGE
ncbi:MAG: hypothetical protein LBU90_10315 [Bacteroidales bacterium]|nr:hypothetical protein [Bacteroidales bacterium]